MQINKPLTTEKTANLQAGSAEPDGAAASNRLKTLLSQNTEWQGESVFPYPPAKGNLLLNIAVAPVYLLCWTLVVSAITILLLNCIGAGTHYEFNQLAIFPILVAAVTCWIYFPFLWLEDKAGEFFNWKIRVSRHTIAFPYKAKPRGWQSEFLPISEILMVTLVSDSFRRVPYDIDEDRRYAHLLVFQRVFWEDVTLRLDEMPKPSRDQFLLALARLLPPEKLSNELQEEIDSIETIIFHRVLGEANGKTKPTTASAAPSNGQHFTDWWNQDFERTLLATNYVPLAPGQNLQAERYVIESYLASGGQSTTYLARANDGKAIVVKESVVAEIVDPSVRKKAQQLFARESRLLMKCHHPRIACILDHFTENGRDYLVTEYIEGMTLRQFVHQNGRQPEEVVVKWAESIVEFFVYLHSLAPAIIHRDVSPDNLILHGTSDIFLIDFGAANDTIGNLTGTMIGKQSYMAPEQFRGKACCASDIYAFGGLLYFLTTGHDPVPLSVCHLKETITDASPALDKLIAACTSQDSEPRPEGVAIAALLKNWTGVQEHLEGT